METNEKAAEWMKKGCDLGFGLSLHEYGSYCWYGYGVAEDPRKAYECFKKSIKAGCELSYYYLGCMYDGGQSVPRDANKAIKYYKRGAEFGDSNCVHMMNIINKKST
jgi:TPR repeat protein